MTQCGSCAMSVRVASFFLILLTGTVAAAQQPPVTYRFDWVSAPAGQTSASVNGLNNYGLVVGRFWGPLGVGFVYDSQGVFGAPNTLHLLSELISIPAEWSSSSCVGINDEGLVVGYFSNESLTRGYVLDLITGIWSYLPHPTGSNHVAGYRVNNYGEVLAYFMLDGGQFAYLYHVADPPTEYAFLSDPATDVPIALGGNLLDLNNQGEVFGTTANGWFRLTPGLLLESINDPSLRRLEAMNDSGALCGYAARYIRKNSTLSTACRYFNQVEFVYEGSDRTAATDINNDGDLAVQVNYYRASLYDSSGYGLLNLDNLLDPNTPQADREYWLAARIVDTRLNERDGTGFPQIAGQAELSTTTTGGGKPRITPTDIRIFVLRVCESINFTRIQPHHMGP